MLAVAHRMLRRRWWLLAPLLFRLATSDTLLSDRLDCVTVSACRVLSGWENIHAVWDHCVNKHVGDLMPNVFVATRAHETTFETEDPLEVSLLLSSTSWVEIADPQCRVAVVARPDSTGVPQRQAAKLPRSTTARRSYCTAELLNFDLQ